MVRRKAEPKQRTELSNNEKIPMMRSGSETPANVLLESEKQWNMFPLQHGDRTLCEVDDFVKHSLFDHLMGFPSNKCFPDHKRIPLSVQEAIASLLMMNVFSQNCVEVGKVIYSILSLYFKDEGDRMQTIIDNYLRLFDPSSGVTIGRCKSYKQEKYLGMKLVATKNWQPGEILHLHNLSTSFDQNTWPLLNAYSSTLSSNYKRCSNLWLGAAAIANHECNPNAKYRIEQKTQKILIEVTKHISIGEEIFVSYGHEYFGNDCECESCRKKKASQMPTETVKPNTEPRDRRPRRPNLTCNGNSNTQDFSKYLNREDRTKIFLIYKNLFKNIKYPKEFEKSLEESEQQIAENLEIITLQNLSNMFIMGTQTLPTRTALTMSNCIVGPELQTFEQNTLKQLLILNLDINKTVVNYSNICKSTFAEDRLQIQSGVLGGIMKMACDSLSMLQVYQNGLSETRNSMRAERKSLDEKERETRIEMQNALMNEGDCEMLGGLKERISADIASRRRNIYWSWNYEKDEQEEDLQTPKRRRLNTPGDSSREISVDDDEFGAADIELPSCPRQFQKVFDRIIGSEINPPTAEEERQLQLDETFSIPEPTEPANELLTLKLVSALNPQKNTSFTVALHRDGVGLASTDRPLYADIDDTVKVARLDEAMEALKASYFFLAAEKQKMIDQ